MLGKPEDFVQPNGHLPATVVMIIIFVFVFNILAIAYLTKRQKVKNENKLKNEVQEQVSHYFKLQNNDSIEDQS